MLLATVQRMHPNIQNVAYLKSLCWEAPLQNFHELKFNLNVTWQSYPSIKDISRHTQTHIGFNRLLQKKRLHAKFRQSSNSRHCYELEEVLVEN